MYAGMRIWPEDYQSFWEINNHDYVVEIKWSKSLFKDYLRLANEYSQCGYLLVTEIIHSQHDNIKSDTWFLTGIYLLRQGIQLGLKALICRVCSRNSDIQMILEEYKHNLSQLFTFYIEKEDNYLSNDQKQWLSSYFASIEEVDAKSDMFRFPFEEEFLSQFRYKRLDIVAVANNLYHAFDLLTNCLDCNGGWGDLNMSRDPKFLILSENFINTCYLWEPISDHGFHSKISGYIQSADFIFYKCNSITIAEKLYPLIFLLRNAIELCLKRLFYARVENGVPKRIFYSKRSSHLLKKDLWENVRPMIQHYSIESDEDLDVIDIVESRIFELDSLDKNGDCFRYPTSYSLEYRYNGKNVDTKNVFEYMRAIINFLEGCDSMLTVISDNESEIYSDYYL